MLFAAQAMLNNTALCAKEGLPAASAELQVKPHASPRARRRAVTCHRLVTRGPLSPLLHLPQPPPARQLPPLPPPRPGMSGRARLVIVSSSGVTAAVGGLEEELARTRLTGLSLPMHPTPVCSMMVLTILTIAMVPIGSKARMSLCWAPSGTGFMEGTLTPGHTECRIVTVLAAHVGRMARAVRKVRTERMVRAGVMYPVAPRAGRPSHAGVISLQRQLPILMLARTCNPPTATTPFLGVYMGLTPRVIRLAAARARVRGQATTTLTAHRQ